MAINGKVIITCTVTGAIHTPTMSPYLPITPDEIARESIAAAEAGAAIPHLHARDPETGKPAQTPRPSPFSCPASSRVRRRRSTLPPAAGQTCYDHGKRFEFECYDIVYLYNLAHLANGGLVKPPFFVQSVFGLLDGIGSHPEDVAHMKRTADRLFGDTFRWSVLGAGAAQLRVAAQAAALGGNIRVGLEDSLWAGKGKLAKSNAEQVTLARKIIEGLGMEVATPDEARQILELKGADQFAY